MISNSRDKQWNYFHIYILHVLFTIRFIQFTFHVFFGFFFFRQIVVTNKTQIFRTPSSMLDIPEEIIENGRRLLTTNESTNNETVEIIQAATSPKKTILNVTGIVYKVSTSTIHPQHHKICIYLYSKRF